MKRALGTVVALAAIAVLVVAVAASGKQSSPTKHGGHHGTTARPSPSSSTPPPTPRPTRVPPETASATSSPSPTTSSTPPTPQKVGTDQGYCLRVVAGASYECTWTTFLPGGQIVVAGPFYDAKDSTLAITGGTGPLPQRPRHDGPPLARRRHRVRLRVPPRRLSQGLRPRADSWIVRPPPGYAAAGARR